MSQFAWVTLATNDSYSLGALVVANSLKKVATKHQLAVLITPGVTDSMRVKLNAVFDLVQEVNVLDSKDAANLSLLARPELGVTFTKLHCWRLTQYTKCVFVDADTLILQNADELFEREELSAAPDVGWPDCFNSGVFVYRPSQQTFEKLIAFAVQKGSFDGGDQGLLNLFFADWATKDIARHLPFVYNTCSTACYSYLPAFKQFGEGVKILHFIGQLKPWTINFDSATRTAVTPHGFGHLAKFLQLWWDIFCNEIHPRLSADMSGIAGALAQLTLGAPRSTEQTAYEDSMRQQFWESGNIDYMGTRNVKKTDQKTVQKSDKKLATSLTKQQQLSKQTAQQSSTTVSSSTTTSERRSSITQSSQQVTTAERRSSITQESTKESSKTQTQTQTPGIDTSQPVVIIPGHQKVEYDAATKSKVVTERTTTGYQQTITSVTPEGVTKTQVKTFFYPVEVAAEETIEEEEEIYEETQTTEPTTKTTTTKTTTGASNLVSQVTEDQKTQQTKQKIDESTKVVARELPQNTITKKVLGEENVRYETVVSEDGKTTTTRKIVTQPAEEIEIIEYEEHEVTEEETKVSKSDNKKRQTRSVVDSENTVVSEDGRKVSKKTVNKTGDEIETIEYEEERIEEPAAKPKTVTKITTIPSKDVRKKETVDHTTASTTTEVQETKQTSRKVNQDQQEKSRTVVRRDDTQVAGVPAKAVVRNTLPDGQEVEVESAVSEDGKTKILKKTVRQPEEETEVEDYEETSTVVPKKRTTTKNNTVVAVVQDDEEQENTIKSDKTKTVKNKVASETILVSADTEKAIGQHQEVEERTDTTNVKGVATTKVTDGRVTTNVGATTTNTKTMEKEENTVLGNTKKTSKSSASSTKTTTISSSQSVPTQSVQPGSLSDRNLEAIQQSSQIQKTDKSVTSAITDKRTTDKQVSNKKVTEQQEVNKRVTEEQQLQTQQKQQQSTNKNTSSTVKESTTTTTTTTLTKQQQTQKTQMLSQLGLTTADKQFTTTVGKTTTDTKTGDVTTEEIRHFNGGTEHIYTTVGKNGSLRVNSETFFNSVPVESIEEQQTQKVQKEQTGGKRTSDDKSSTSKTTTTTTKTTLTKQQEAQKTQMLSQLGLTTADKKYTSSVVGTTTDAKTGDVTTEEVRRFAGGTEHIYTTVCKDGTLRMNSKTFFEAVPVVGSEVTEEEEEYEEVTTTTSGQNVSDLAKKKLRTAASSNETESPIPPPRKKEVKQVTPQKDPSASSLLTTTPSLSPMITLTTAAFLRLLLLLSICLVLLCLPLMIERLI